MHHKIEVENSKIASDILTVIIVVRILTANLNIFQLKVQNKNIKSCIMDK